jgi:hypothetical protein
MADEEYFAKLEDVARRFADGIVRAYDTLSADQLRARNAAGAGMSDRHDDAKVHVVALGEINNAFIAFLETMYIWSEKRGYSGPVFNKEERKATRDAVAWGAYRKRLKEHRCS